MINFLPPEQKKELLAEEKFKLILILGIVVLSSFLSLFLILFSIKTYLVGQLEIQEIILSDKEKELKISQLGGLEQKINEYNSSFSKSASFYQSQIKPSHVFEKISKILPPDVYLTSFDFALNKVSLSGFSPTREKLLELKENLEKEETFKEIYFPPSNWVGKININFTANFKYEPKK